MYAIIGLHGVYGVHCFKGNYDDDVVSEIEMKKITYTYNTHIHDFILINCVNKIYVVTFIVRKILSELMSK